MKITELSEAEIRQRLAPTIREYLAYRKAQNRMERAHAALLALRRAERHLIFSYVAEMERETLRQRTKAGLARARAEGIRIGRPWVDPRTVKAALELGRSGAPIARAARQAGLGEGTVRRALANSRQ